MESSSGNLEIDTKRLFLPLMVKGDDIDTEIRKLLKSKFATISTIDPILTETDFSHPAQTYSNKSIIPLTPPASPLPLLPTSSEHKGLLVEEPEWGTSKAQPFMEPESYTPNQPDALLSHHSKASSHVALPKGATQDFGERQTERNSSKDTSFIVDRRLTEVKELSALARSYYQSAQLQQARRIYEDIIKEVKTIKEWDSNIMIKSMITAAQFDIAVITLQQGRFNIAAIELEALEHRAPGEFPIFDDLPWAIGRWLAVALDRQGRYFEAKAKLDEILRQIREAKIKPEYVDSVHKPVLEMAALLTRNALALVMAHLGDCEKAKSLSENAIKVIDDQLKPGAGDQEAQGSRESLLRRLSRFKGILACILALAGDYKQAEEKNQDASKTLEQYLGVRCVATLECWSLGAWLLAALGRIDEAESKCNKTLDWMRLVLGKDHPSTLQTLGVLVYVYTSQARLTEARNTAKFLIEEDKRILGASHPQTICAMGLLAKIYVARGEFEIALPLQMEVREAANTSLGLKHPSTLRYSSDLAMIHCNMGNWSTAKSLSAWVFSEQCHIFLGQFTDSKESIPGTIPVPESTGSEQVVDDKLLIDFLQRLQSHNESLSKFHPYLFSTMHCIGIVLREMKSGNLENNLDLALRFHTDAKDFRNRKLGEDHPLTLISQLQLAITQQRRGDFGSARQNVEEVLKSRNTHLGEDHPDSLSARHELSLIKSHLGKLKEASEDQADILRLRTLLLGADHPDTKESQQELPTMLEHLHIQALAYQMQLSDKAMNECSLLSQELLKKLEEAVVERLRHSAVEKGSMLRNGIIPANDTHLTQGATASIKALVSVYVGQHSFDKAVELQAVLNYHQELDLGHNDDATLMGMRTLASIYQLQATAQFSQLSDLAKAEASRSGAFSTILLQYYETLSDLAFLYAGTGDLETAHAIHKDVEMKIKDYKARGDKQVLNLEVRALIDLAKITRRMGDVNEAESLLKEARECNRNAGNRPGLGYEMHIAKLLQDNRASGAGMAG
jgi:tetratricopeptide (TPR) repeat protein